MAGSLKWFVYTADDGATFALKGDESNIEGVNGSTGDYDGTSTAIYSIPRNLKPRYATYANIAGTIRKNVVALTTAIFTAIAPGDTITDQNSGQTLILTGKTGEKLTLPKAEDTGLTDNDAT